MKKLIVLFMALSSLLLVSCDKDIDATHISVISKTIYLNVGSETEIMYNVLPSDTTSKEIVWESSNGEVVTVNEGKVKGIAIGEAIITMKLRKQIDISETINVYVVEKQWPTSNIIEVIGFSIPAFPDYMGVTVETSESGVTLIVKGVSNDVKAMQDYKTILTNNGFEVSESFDEHIGTASKGEFIISVHNHYVHSGDKITIEVSKKAEPKEVTMGQLTSIVKEMFPIEIPNFTLVSKITAIEEENEVEFSIDFTDRKSALAAFFQELESKGWSKVEGSNNHLGSYKLGEVIISYHESHDDAVSVDFVIANEDDNHDHDHGHEHNHQH
ncbi:MAG: Ig-like domain-containing protein [Acholeplasma sp.]|nr:Ig-like domain-containing protein [Acholeplasma sp.]